MTCALERAAYGNHAHHRSQDGASEANERRHGGAAFATLEASVAAELSMAAVRRYPARTAASPCVVLSHMAFLKLIIQFLLSFNGVLQA